MAKVTLRSIKRRDSVQVGPTGKRTRRSPTVADVGAEAPPIASQSGTGAADRGPSRSGASGRPGASPSEETAATGADSLPVADDQADDDDDVATLEIGEQPEPIGRGRARLRAPRPPEPAAKPEKGGVALDANGATMLLMMIDAITANNLGPDAKFSAEERKLIEPSLKRMLSRMTPASAKVFGSIADPVLLCTGLAMWGARVFGARPRPATAGQPSQPQQGQQAPFQMRQQPVPAAPAAPAATAQVPDRETLTAVNEIATIDGRMRGAFAS